MDDGCEFNAYSSDITRTWPVNGKFTPAQKELYQIVLDVQQLCIQVIRFVFSSLVHQKLINKKALKHRYNTL